MAAIVTYLAHLRGSERDADASEMAAADRALCELLSSINPAELVDWRLGPFLSGEYVIKQKSLA